MKRFAALALALALAGCVTVAPQGAGMPPPMPSYVSVHAELASKFPNEPMVAPSGVTVDWGGFQSKYIAAGTTFGITRGDPEAGLSFMLGGGTQFHIPIGPKVLLIPALNLGYRLMTGPGGNGLATGLDFSGSLGAVYRFDKMYAGFEAATPFLLQGPTGVSAFPGAVTVNALWGLYY